VDSVRPVSSRVVPVLLFATILLLWGTGYRGTAIGAEHSDPLVFAAMRTLPSLVLLWAIVGLRRLPMPPRRTALILGLTGLLLVSTFIWALTEGVARAGAANTSVLVASSPLFTALLSRVFFGEHLPVDRVAGLLLGFAGVFVMFSSELRIGGGDIALGMVIALIGGLAWAIGTVIVKAVGARVDLIVMTALQFLVGAPVLVAIAFAESGSGNTEWSSGIFWAAVFYVGLGGLGGTLAFFACLRIMSAVRATAVQFLVPIVAILVEVLRGNVPDAVTFVGMAIAIVGVAAVNVPILSRRRVGVEAALPPP
jgi:drug/metabolite transporter (DMT)-like permease